MEQKAPLQVFLFFFFCFFFPPLVSHKLSINIFVLLPFSLLATFGLCPSYLDPVFDSYFLCLNIVVCGRVLLKIFFLKNKQQSNTLEQKLPEHKA